MAGQCYRGTVSAAHQSKRRPKPNEARREALPAHSNSAGSFPSLTPLNLHLSVLGICTAAIALIYAQTLSFGFVGFDDTAYVTQHAWVRSGVTWQGVWNAFGSDGGIYWQPLTWLSHMLDVSFFGLNPGPQHLQNAIWHTGSMLLLFVVARRFGLGHWASLACSLLWGLHPLRVESVAWIAGRKDVLSGFFWLLSVWLYIRYAEAPSARHYLTMFGAALLGYLAKPTMVTFPFVLLLLDVWPLHRQLSWGKRITEKLPFFALSLVISVITYWSQQQAGALAMTHDASFVERIQNAAIAYCWYLRKTIWPIDLAVVYPYPASVPVLSFAGASIVLGAVTLLLAWQRDRCSALLVGWLSFLGVLVPMIGLVQAGPQPYADRFTYIASVPLLLAVVATVSGFVSRRSWHGLAAASMFAIIAALGVLSYGQVGVWKDGEVLFTHAHAVADHNTVASMNLGAIRMAQGRYQEALPLLEEAAADEPKSAVHRYNLGVTLAALEKFDLAAQQLRQATTMDPSRAEAWAALGSAQKGIGNRRQAIESMKRAIALGLEPSREVAVRTDLATLLATQGRLIEAEHEFRNVLAADATNERARMNFAVLLARTGRRKEAVAEAQVVLTRNPNHGQARAMVNALGPQVQTVQ